MTIKQRIVFCDFDGTITENDNIIAIIKHFNPPGWEELVDKIISGVMSIQEGVGTLFRLLPATLKDEVIAYGINNAKIRKGFAEFLAFCKEQNIIFYVTSGGIDFFVYPILSKFNIPVDFIYCNGSDFSGNQIEITWPHTCDDDCPSGKCGMCKTSIIRSYSPDEYERILIGDSVTDFEGAKIADVVFSRSHLTTKCKEINIASTEYETFFDIIEALKLKGND